MFFLLFRWFRRLVYVCLLVAFAYLVVTSVQVLVASHEASGLPTIGRDPVIVVIGSPTTATISPDLEQRCALAYALYEDHHSTTIVTTGASSSAGVPSEAAVAADCLARHHVRGVRAVAVSPIPDQLERVAGMLSPAQRAHVVLVADPLQTKWLEGVAASVGLQAQIAAAPVPKQGFWTDAGTIWSQSLAVGVGRIFGYKSTGWIGG